MANLKAEGITLDAAKGEEEWFMVTENPTTGFSWILNDTSCSEDIVLIQSKFFAPETATSENDEDGDDIPEEEMEGVGGVRWFNVSAVGEGKCEL